MTNSTPVIPEMWRVSGRSGICWTFRSCHNLPGSTRFTFPQTIPYAPLWATLDTTPPTVERTQPKNRASGALLAGPITADFSEQLDPATVTTSSVQVTGPSGAIAGAVSLSPDKLTVIFTPTTPFPYTTRYDVTLTTAIKDVAGNALAADHTWFFRTGKRVAVGWDHNCARLDDGGLKCWGYNGRGQLGLGDGQNRGDQPNEMGSNLPRVNLGSQRTVVQVVVGAEHSCARLDNNKVKCWGGNTSGQLGLGLGALDSRGDEPGEMGGNLSPVDLGSDSVVVDLAAGSYHTCARFVNGGVKCWGNNDFGQLGYGDVQKRGYSPSDMGDNLPYVDLGSGRLARGISAGAEHTCARLDDGTTKCWGYNFSGQLGQGDTNDRGDQAGEMGDSLLPIELGSGLTVQGIESGYGHNCARFDNGSMKCWGLNNWYQLNTGDANNRGDQINEMGDFLLPLYGSGQDVTGLALGGGHTCASFDGGALACWGLNQDGQLGLGVADQITGGQVDIGVGRAVEEISSMGNHTCARFDNGEVKCWGLNDYGALGYGDSNTRGDDPGETVGALPAVDIGN